MGWVRDPAYYQSIWTYKSDVPAHEGPTHHALVELWQYDFPLSDAEDRRLAAELSVIPPLLRQARNNLTGNARDLWITGIRDIRQQRASLDQIDASAGGAASPALRAAIRAAGAATDQFIDWL